MQRMTIVWLGWALLLTGCVHTITEFTASSPLGLTSEGQAEISRANWESANDSADALQSQLTDLSGTLGGWGLTARVLMGLGTLATAIVVPLNSFQATTGTPVAGRQDTTNIIAISGALTAVTAFVLEYALDPRALATKYDALSRQLDSARRQLGTPTKPEDFQSSTSKLDDLMRTVAAESPWPNPYVVKRIKDTGLVTTKVTNGRDTDKVKCAGTNVTATEVMVLFSNGSDGHRVQADVVITPSSPGMYLLNQLPIAEEIRSKVLLGEITDSSEFGHNLVRGLQLTVLLQPKEQFEAKFVVCHSDALMKSALDAVILSASPLTP